VKRSKLSGIIPVVFFILIWEFLGRAGIFQREIFPPFTAVLNEFFVLLKGGVLLENFLASFKRVVIGFFLGAITGIFAGIIMGCNRVLDRTFSPLISFLYPVPALGWLPVLMLWIGVNDMLPITIIFICSFFPVCYSTVSGIKNVDRNIIDVARTLGATKFKVLKNILLPLALPYIFTGLRLEAGMAWRVIIAAEMVAIPVGLGSLMMRAESLIRMDIIIVCLFVLSVMTFLFEKILFLLVKKLIFWKSE